MVDPKGELQLIQVNELLYVSAADDYATLHLRDGSVHLHDKTLTALALLLPARFERIHRSTIVDLSEVQGFLTEPGSRYFVRLSDGTRLAVSRSKVADLRSKWD